jgi:hypothetical protein
VWGVWEERVLTPTLAYLPYPPTPPHPPSNLSPYTVTYLWAIGVADGISSYRENSIYDPSRAN